MRYEVIQEIKNSCSGNQLRDVFISEEELSDPEAWIRAKEPRAVSIEKEELKDGFRFYVTNAELLTVYTLSETD
ncbi:MAG: hypothetical protein GX942_09105 [Papillibacter sp.]|jgi:hypothetical protein|nr:hypothetical protein [Papillibacter sp.]